MFCNKCGKEISNDSRICAYCGAPVQAEGQPYNMAAPSSPPYQVQANNQQYYNNQANNQQYYNGQPNNQQYYNGQPNNQQYYNGQPSNQPYSSYGDKSLKPDNKFNLAAALFTWLWALVKGMWDLALFDFAVGFLFLIPVAGQIFAVLYLIFRIAVVGRNANYYYRLKVTMGIPMYKAMMDPNLRRI